MTWREFIRENADTAGITLVFAALGSGFMLWASANRQTTIKAVTPGRAIMVIAAGQLVGAVATAFCFGFLSWNLFVAPGVGALCGLVGVFILMASIKGGERIEDRGADLADRGIELIARKKGDMP